MAAGRDADTEHMGLQDVGVDLHPVSRKVLGGHEGDNERSSLPHVYGIGDVLEVIYNIPTLSKN